MNVLDARHADMAANHDVISGTATGAVAGPVPSAPDERTRGNAQALATPGATSPANDSTRAAGGAHAQTERNIAELVATIYEAAPVAARVRLLDYLLRPLGALSILVVADGVFGRIWFRHGWCEFRIRPEDIRDVEPEHVVALVEHVLQRRADTVYELPDMLGATPHASRSVAVERLWALLGRKPPTERAPRSTVLPLHPARERAVARAAAR